MKNEYIMSTISLEGMKFYAYHGCFAEERAIGTWFECSLAIETDTSAAQRSDRIEDTLNYLEVYQKVKKTFESPCRLLESLAQRIGEELMRAYPEIESLRVKVSKLNPPSGGQLERGSVSLDMQNTQSSKPIAR